MKTEHLEIWKTYVSIWDGESNRFWVRSNVFLLVNGALLTVVTGFSKIPMVSIIVSIFGAILTYFWLQTNKIGKHYVDRWKTFIWESEKKMDDDLGFSNRLSTLKNASKYNVLRSSTYYMSIVIRLLIIIWLIIGSYFFLQISKNTDTIFLKKNIELSISIDGETYILKKKN